MNATQDSRNDLNVTWTAVAGLVGAILVFVFIVAIQILFQHAQQAQYQKNVVAQAPEQLGELRAEQLAKVTTYRLVDARKGLVAIPVEEAIKVFARDPVAGMQAVRAAAATQPAPATTTATAPATHPGGPRS